MISGRHCVEEEDGAVVLDEDPEVFLASFGTFEKE